jgi:hypothetical protein
MNQKEKKTGRHWNSLKKGWMIFALALGWFNTRLLLTVFYLILGIPALVLKLIGKDLLDRGFKNRSSYWIKKENVPHTTERARHQF